jgi:hypothetical protein
VAIAEAAAVALSVALIALVAFVLPAEYGMDPLGTGNALGLTAMSQAAPPPITPSTSGPLAVEQSDYKVDSIAFTLRPNQFVEYKYQLQAGATMLYTWTATAPVELDFHTEPEGKSPDASDSFERGMADQGHGSYRAPYPGIHGWYWHNRGTSPVTITLTTAGFYTLAREFRDDGTSTSHEVRPLARSGE